MSAQLYLGVQRHTTDGSKVVQIFSGVGSLLKEYQRLTGQLGHGDLMALEVGEPVGSYEYVVYLENIADAEGAVYYRQVDEGYIYLADLEQFDGVRGSTVCDLKLYLGIFCMELFKVGQQEKLAQSVAGAYHKAA